MLPKALLVCIFDLLLVRGAYGWNHVARDQFESITAENEVSLVAFVAPWTEPSKALEPEWLSATARSQNSLISIDCTIEEKLCKEHEIISYPTIRLFKKQGEQRRYRGPRKASSILEFMSRAPLPPVSILDKSNITSFKSSDEAVFIAYIPDKDGHLKSIFTSLAKRHSDRFTFGIATDPKLAKMQNVQFPSVVCHRSEDGEQEVFSGEAGLDALQNFIETAAAPTIGEFTRRNELKYMKARKSIVYYFTSSDEDRSAYIASVKPLAKTYKEYLNFVTVDIVELGHMLPALGLAPDSEAALAVYNPMYGQAFPFNEDEITPKAVENFVMDIAQGKIQPLGVQTPPVEGHTEL
ncbi:thioredoxin-like domain-containing protein [Leptodontidium sp. 2 PMI_412]|nr:thioredoxin-like domain-containing protein [Leptodontidium sp. 2 PMI_412]